jgi:hypothetical protein
MRAGSSEADILSVHAAHIEANKTHPLLRASHRQAGRTDVQHGFALVRLVDIDPSHLADDAIHGNSPLLLKCLDRRLGHRPELSVDRTRIEPQRLKRLL